ncbi:unnamed protein product [Rotaria sordida]|uniref:Uncharacterized protein n=1 Tax=Rotaria sordida TaxID=392033 RepID=A0A813UDR0_9BILA|nr:unnamed protein product [Rotaria sordida]
MGLCHGSNSSTIEKSLNPNENLDIYTIIWLDNKNKKKSQKNISIQQLRTIINHLKIFEDENDCEEYIKQMSQDEYIIFITDDQIGEKFISRIHHLQQIFSIYIYSSNNNIDQPWINQYNKIKSICLNYNELIKQIEFDQIKYKYIKNKILFDIFYIDKLNNSNDKFIYSQIFIETLLQMDSMPNDMNDFITLCRNQYKGNKFQLNILREFQQNYTSDYALWWFTRDTFISHLLNKALRIQNIDLIFLLRFFIHDIEQQLKEYHCLTPIQVYRYELMLNRELDLLKDSIGQFISINNFLLTQVNRDSALPSSIISLNNTDFQSVLFKITTDSNLDKIKPFAYITSQNSFHNTNNQDEVLFMLGSIFEIKNIYQDINNLWIIEMELSSRTNKHLKPIFKNYKNNDNNNDDDDDEINLLSYGYILQKMNKLDEAKKYYCRLLNELSDEDERLGCCLLNLGNIDFLNKNYDTSLEWLLKSLDISLRTLQPNDIFFARIYYSMGHVYNEKNESKLALESYDKAIIIWKQSIDDNYLNIAECMNNIGIIYKEENNYSLALEFFKKTLTILEKYISHDDFDISKAQCNLASTYRQLGQYDLALEHYNISFKILQKYYSMGHPNIAKALGNIGIVHALKGERQKALLYYEKAAEIYRHTLPPTHTNNIKIEQLIRNLSMPHPKLSFGPIESR